MAVPAGLLTSSDARRQGQILYLQNCALCHGERGDGRGVRREALTRAPRDFTLPSWRQSTSPRHVFFAIREGVKGTSMPSWANLSDQDAWNVTAHVLSLGGRP